MLKIFSRWDCWFELKSKFRCSNVRRLHRGKIFLVKISVVQMCVFCHNHQQQVPFFAERLMLTKNMHWHLMTTSVVWPPWNRALNMVEYQPSNVAGTFFGITIEMVTVFFRWMSFGLWIFDDLFRKKLNHPIDHI